MFENVRKSEIEKIWDKIKGEIIMLLIIFLVIYFNIPMKDLSDKS